ncbi:MAG TPA: hypothetical protein PKD90_04425 [Phnomibacter sp.]|nr:hypothetical protein [Phnomibacter sp.]
MHSACSSSKNTGVWINEEKIKGKAYQSVFVAVISADVTARATVETDLATAAANRGYKVVKSIDVLTPNLGSPAAPTKEAIMEAVKKSGCQAVMLASLLRKEEDVRYVPGRTPYSIMPYYAWHGNIFGYYSHWHPMMYQPGYYEQSRSYFMQSNLFDAASEEIMWSVQSEVFNPGSLRRFSSSYTETLVRQLERAGLLKK